MKTTYYSAIGNRLHVEEQMENLTYIEMYRKLSKGSREWIRGYKNRDKATQDRMRRSRIEWEYIETFLS